MKIRLIFLYLFLTILTFVNTGEIELNKLSPYFTKVFEEAIIDIQFINEQMVALTSNDVLYIIDFLQKKIIGQIILDADKESLNFVNYLASLDPFILYRMRSSILAINWRTQEKITIFKEVTDTDKWTYYSDTINKKIIFASTQIQKGTIIYTIFDDAGNLEHNEYIYFPSAPSSEKHFYPKFLYLCALYYPYIAFLMDSGEMYFIDGTRNFKLAAYTFPSLPQNIIFDRNTPFIMYGFNNGTMISIDIEKWTEETKNVIKAHSPIHKYQFALNYDLICTTFSLAVNEKKNIRDKLYISSFRKNKMKDIIITLPIYDSKNFLMAGSKLSPDFNSLAAIGYDEIGCPQVKIFYLDKIIFNNLSSKQNILSILQKREYGRKLKGTHV